uniref:VWFA domain-containing protein n=1 Tax=Anabas testudineus TaxID=64144 RepID=A0A3Q1IYB7_ANATE
MCFNIEPVAWQTFRRDAAVPDFAVNMSLGLTMTSDPRTQKTLACGPTIPKDCKSITMYSGVCFEIDLSNAFGPPLPSTNKECRTEADIAFLLDGSGSVGWEDFERMKTFVKEVVRSFPAKDTQFALAQFSSETQIHYYFNDFFSGSWEANVGSVRQLYGGTYTATGIRTVVENVFTQTKGSRPNVKKILIVITDGESHQRNQLPSAAATAEAKNIVRFAIGVGNAFLNPGAKYELDTIASSPSQEHVFRVASFDALEKIKQSLATKIFSIEGTQTSGESLKMEMAQEGFSAAYFTETGSCKRLIPFHGRCVYNSDIFCCFPPLCADDLLLAQFQSGEYFGAEVCAMNLDEDQYTDLILISAPMYKESDREGRVYVCTLTNLCNLDFSPLVLRGGAFAQGRFGSSLAVLPDLNLDKLSDLAVGAPLENDGQGSIYIFNGEAGRINPTYSQRIAGSEVQSGLKFFGMSISQSSFDRSGDKLPDLAVGSKGTVVLLRSKPIVMIEASVSFNPTQIPTQNDDCSKPLVNTATICFTMTSSKTNTAKINYTLTLDATRKVPNNRAYISEKQRQSSGSTTISIGQNCLDVKFSIDACPEDALNELINELKFTFDGVPSSTNLKPSLDQRAQTLTFHPLGFEINCGTDGKCVDNIKLDFNFTSSSEVRVGIDELLEATVSVENSGENSYNSRVILTYPPGLSYRKFTILKGRIDCNSLDSENGLSRGKTECTVDSPFSTLLVSFSFLKLGDKDIWVDSNNLQVTNDETTKPETGCSVARCAVFKCTGFIGRGEKKQYIISANLSSGWIEQIGLHSAKFLLTSTASLEYDKNQYIYFSTGSNTNPPIRKIEAEVEVYPEPDFTKEIVGGSLGGLALLVLLTAGLYKAGFFKSKYKEMINQEAGEGADPGADGGAPAPE